VCNAKKFKVKYLIKHHSTARIANMNDAEKARLIQTLEKWLAIDIENKAPIKQ
jgi:hypothetical protein